MDDQKPAARQPAIGIKLFGRTFVLSGRSAVVSGELHGPIAVVICMIAYWRKTRMEERGLREVFGQAYDEYRRVSWALIPLVF